MPQVIFYGIIIRVQRKKATKENLKRTISINKSTCIHEKNEDNKEDQNRFLKKRSCAKLGRRIDKHTQQEMNFSDGLKAKALS